MELAERPRRDQLVDRDDGRAVEEGVPGHQHEAGPRRQRWPAPSPRRRTSRAASRRRRASRLRALPSRSGGGSRPALRSAPLRSSSSEITSATSLVRGTPGIAPTDEREPLGIEVADRDELRVVQLGEVPDEVRAPVAEPDDSDANRLAHAVARRWRRSANGVRKRSRRSRPSDHPRTYATSMSRASPNVEFARALTCQRPVMPWGTRNRSTWCGWKYSTS